MSTHTYHAKKQITEAMAFVKNFSAQNEPEKYDLYSALLNMVKAIEDLEHENSQLKQEIHMLKMSR